MKKKILFIANYYEDVGAISGQVLLLHQHLLYSTIFSTTGNIIVRLVRFIQLLFVAPHYDTLHAHGCSYRGFLPIFYAFLVAKVYHKRLVTTFHGGDADDFLSKHTWVVKVLRHTDANIVQSDFLKNIFEKYNISCVIIPNIITYLDTPLHCPPITPSSIHLLVTRRLEPQYNVEAIINTFHQLRTHYPKATLVVLGDGSQRSYLQSVSGDNVTFVGKVPNSSIYQYHQQCNIFVNTSLIDNMPISLMEAMNSGLLIVSSKSGGIPSLIEHNVTGLLCESSDLLEQLLWIIGHPTECTTIVSRAREVIRNYQWGTIQEKISGIE